MLARMGARSSRCNVAVDTDRLAVLPVAGTGELSHVRRSRHARWRAATLVGVHLLFAAHVTHWLVAGRTLSPVEPSESMYTIELGYLNAGFVFFAVTLLATLIFGRFFCGWGCHLVAVQDLCGYLMKRLGIRPRPFRSRLLAFAPLVVALYMFAWPTVRRLVAGEPRAFDRFTNHLVTAGFWDTFPGPWFAVLTLLTCGFAAVYFLGAKGFCTYGCPYGAFFGGLDRLSPGRILVTDGCEQCGHCTATCTSNVRVHEEVRRYGMVVDPGCMKCTDCVSVCPKHALYYGFATPALLRRVPAALRPKRRFDLGLGAEAALAAVCVAATLAFRGLYDGPPLLMSVTLGGLTAFATFKLWQLVRRPTVRLQNLTLKLTGRLRPAGRVFAGLAAVWLALTVHSGFVQWHRAWGAYHLNRTEATRADVLAGTPGAGGRLSERHHRAVERSFRHFTIAERWGLAAVPEIELGLAWGHLLRDEPGRAERRIREAVALTPSSPAQHDNLVELLLARQRIPEAIAALRDKLERAGPSAADQLRLADLLAGSGRLAESVEPYTAALALAPDRAEARYNLGGALRRLGRHEEAIGQLRIARDLLPDDPDPCVELGLALEATGDLAGALEAYRRAVELDPLSPESRLHLGPLIQRLEGSMAETPTVPDDRSPAGRATRR